MAVKNGQNDDHDTDQHNDALHEIIVDSSCVAAHKDVYAGEDRHHAYAVDVRDTEGHLEQVGEAVVDRCCVRNQKNENDGRSNDLERFRVISALKVCRHSCRVHMFRHDACSSTEDDPGEQRTDDSVADTDPCRRKTVSPAELAGVADEHDC